ncbi:hypothetical protein C1H76_5868 [Elsinoe australis]|uniref:Uncharacterized protein n=1 Tax=Elsinoe australis TaxID=40998 RepID=A0A4U7AXK2_9PEZI|nr:hypothetical protein C1H76_5868 [Elsinoe australis]
MYLPSTPSLSAPTPSTTPPIPAVTTNITNITRPAAHFNLPIGTTNGIIYVHLAKRNPINTTRLTFSHINYLPFVATGAMKKPEVLLSHASHAGTLVWYDTQAPRRAVAIANDAHLNAALIELYSALRQGGVARRMNLFLFEDREDVGLMPEELKVPGARIEVAEL